MNVRYAAEVMNTEKESMDQNQTIYKNDTSTKLLTTGVTSSEIDPNGKTQHELGAKLDAGKPAVFRGLLDYFPRGCTAVAEVSTLGAKKYAWKGWEHVPDGINRYGDALARHLLAECTEGLYDNGPKGIGVLHAAQVAWNSLARLELIIREQEKKK